MSVSALASISGTAATTATFGPLTGLMVSLVLIVMYFVSVAPTCFILKKAGYEPWRGLIPLYNAYLLFKISWKTSWFWVMVGLSALLGLVSSSGLAQLAASNNTNGVVIMDGQEIRTEEAIKNNQMKEILSTDSGTATILFICTIAVVSSFGVILVTILYCLNLAKSFGHGAGYTIGLLFFTLIFMYILAFERSDYIGPCGEKALATQTSSPKKRRTTKKAKK